MKKAPPCKARFDLNEAIDEVIVLARTAITKSEVSVQIRFMDGLLPVQADRVQVQQVVLNLVLNAVEAMGSVEEGARELSIITEQSRQGSVWPCVIPDRASTRTIASVFSRLSTRRSRPERGWVCRSAAQSSTAMEAGCGSRRTNRAGPCFSSLCRAPTESWTVCRHGSRQRVRERIARQAQAFER